MTLAYASRMWLSLALSDMADRPVPILDLDVNSIGIFVRVAPEDLARIVARTHAHVVNAESDRPYIRADTEIGPIRISCLMTN